MYKYEMWLYLIKFVDMVKVHYKIACYISCLPSTVSASSSIITAAAAALARATLVARPGRDTSAPRDEPAILPTRGRPPARYPP